ncbi:MAG: hypothetical protein JSU70_18570 [Phycisphaerales bacterium]|nr:MAG: hypothetical protein JSU70_18570 [Phycisphaerales bacterium]
MIRIQCRECGHLLQAPDASAGGQVTCPRCENIITVPEKSAETVEAKQFSTEQDVPASKYSRYDLTLLDVPESNLPGGRAGNAAELSTDEQQAAGQVRAEIEARPERKLPWLIDIFLYPTSKAGLLTLAVVILIPLAFGLMTGSLSGPAQKFPPLLVLLTPFACVGFLGITVLGLYFVWYLCECIRTSAAGEIRAPETLGTAPGLGELLTQCFRAVGCFIVFWGPAGVYARYIGGADAVFWSLLVYGVFSFPIGLLAVVLFDSLHGLNPLLILCSICSVFLPYCALVATFATIGFALSRVTPPEGISPMVRFVLFCLCIYLSLVVAHILGWFYHRYQSLLNWDV